MVETWHKLLALLAVATDRVAVMPLFQCVGLLDPRGRFGWSLHTPTRPTPPADTADTAAAAVGLASAPPPTRAACAYRLGEGCFAKLGYPEQLVALPPEHSRRVPLPVALLRTGGIGALIEHVRNATRAGGGITGLLLDVDAIAMQISEDELRAHVETFFRVEAPTTWLEGAGATKPASTSPAGDRPPPKAALELDPIGGGKNGGGGGRGRGRGRGGRRLGVAEEGREAPPAASRLEGDHPESREGRRAVEVLMRTPGGGRCGGGRGGGGGHGGGRGGGHGGGHGGGGGGWLTQMASHGGFPPNLLHQACATREARSFTHQWLSKLSAHTCFAMLKLAGQPYVC